jgi:hypothetical protein
MTGEEITARLTIVSALRTLCLRLPHVSTPAELTQLKRFDALIHAPDHAGARDVESLVAGWSRWWRDGRKAELRAMARRVDAELIDSDRRLASFAVACSAPPTPTSPRGEEGNFRAS